MYLKFKPQQVVYAINTYQYKDAVYQQDFYHIEKVIIESISVDIKTVEYWVKSIKTGEEWGECIPESAVFATKELAAKGLLKLCGL